MPGTKLIHTLLGKTGLTDLQYRQILRDRFGVSSSKDLSEPDQRMLAGILRGLSGKPDESGRQLINREATSRKIWSQFYQLQQFIGRRNANYLAGIIGKVCGEDCAQTIRNGARLDLDRLTPQQAYKVIEALKQRLDWQDTTQCRTVSALDAKARTAGIKAGPASRTKKTRTKEEQEELDAQLAAVPF